MRKGFTLVELAIVLVIIGLLVSGVLAGQGLIQQAVIRSQISQIADINRATNTFYAKYGNLPGDLPNAARYWGQLADLYGPTIGSTATCNGNGDRIIGDQSLISTSFCEMDMGSIGDYNIFEKAFFFQQLSNAGLISDSFGWGEDALVFVGPETAKVNLRAKVQGAILQIDNIVDGRTEKGIYTVGKGHAYVLGNPVYDSVNFEEYYTGVTSIVPILTPIYASGIDTKLDDGFPLSGAVQVENNLDPSAHRCRDEATPPNYDFSTENNPCALGIKADF